MRIYEMQDRSSGETTSTDSGLSLRGVEHMTDWTEKEFDDIASMQVGEEKLYDSGIYIKRTE